MVVNERRRAGELELEEGGKAVGKGESDLGLKGIERQSSILRVKEASEALDQAENRVVEAQENLHLA